MDVGVTCSHCDGTGYNPKLRNRFCTGCGGTGHVNHRIEPAVPRSTLDNVTCVGMADPDRFRHDRPTPPDPEDWVVDALVDLVLTWTRQRYHRLEEGTWNRASQADFSSRLDVIGDIADALGIDYDTKIHEPVMTRITDEALALAAREGNTR